MYHFGTFCKCSTGKCYHSAWGDKKCFYDFGELREENGLKQGYIARKLKISREVYSRYETGKRNIPNLILADLAKHYKVTTDYLLGISDIKNPYEK